MPEAEVTKIHNGKTERIATSEGVRDIICDEVYTVTIDGNEVGTVTSYLSELEVPSGIIYYHADWKVIFTARAGEHPYEVHNCRSLENAVNLLKAGKPSWA